MAKSTNYGKRENHESGDYIKKNQERIAEILATGVPVKLRAPENGDELEEVQIWEEIDQCKLDFNKYKTFVDDILSCNPGEFKNLKKGPRKDAEDCSDQIGDALFSSANDKKTFLNRSLLTSTQGYELLKFATDRYLRRYLGLEDDDLITLPGGNTIQPYQQLILEQLDALTNGNNQSATGFLRMRDRGLRVELIWNYWHEEAMLVQTMQAITKRFQNIRSNNNDVLANLELDPLRPLSNILWGYVQDAHNRLTVTRRAYEYDHHYGLRLLGKVLPNFNPADSRSKFLEAFHNLLHKCTIYFNEADDMTRRADAFPLLNALREVHLLLTEGAHNQFGDLPITSRVEMMMEQWMLARQEMAEFLRGRTMVLYDEPWMGAVDAMKTLQGWNNTSVSFYNDLAEFGEDLLLTIRHTPWTRINDRIVAAAWANRYRDMIQRYIYSYSAVTGVDLSAALVANNQERAIMPGILIYRKTQREKLYQR